MQIFRTPFELQAIKFNMPYQIGRYTKGGHQKKQFTHHSLEYTHDIEENDIIVMASDGLFDNVFDEGIEECLKDSLTENKINDVLLAS